MTILWSLAAAVALAAGVAVVYLAQGELFSDYDRGLSQDEISHELDQAATATPSGPASPEESDASGETESPGEEPPPGELIDTDGGQATAVCRPEGAELLWWVPDQGFAVDEVEAGPSAEASIQFDDGESEVEVTVTCDGDKPVASVEHDD